MSHDDGAYMIEDDGTMPENADALAAEIVGHRIVRVERNATVPEPAFGYGSGGGGTSDVTLHLDDGRRVSLMSTSDCCAYTELGAIIEHLPTMDHIITGVTTSDGFTKWHIIADLGEVLELEVEWSSGNPFYYAYGFEIIVDGAPEAVTS